ncbi:MAG: hypothetical protein Q7R33_01900 [Nitrosarchaeum sp.]|nr:hypothetical protein [Nitrosarchaeum sp.]
MAVYFVNATGSDTAPFDTSAKGAHNLKYLIDNVVLDNDTINFVAGSTIYEDVSILVDPLTTPSIKTIVYQSWSENSERPVWKHKSDIVTEFEHAYHIIDGLVIVKESGVLSYPTLRASITHFTLQNCRCYMETMTGLMPFVDYNTASTITKIKNNIFYDLPAEAVKCSDFGLPTNTIVLTNNVVYNYAKNASSLTYAFDVSQTSTPTDTVKIFNNIIHGNHRVYTGGIKVNGTPAILQQDYNCIYGVDTAYSGTIAGSHNLSVDPLFKDVDNHNFRLTLISPCIDTGVGQIEQSDILSTDYRQIDRPQIIQGLVDIPENADPVATFIYDDFATGTFNSWWDAAFTTNYTIARDFGIYVAKANEGVYRNITPGYDLEGKFAIETSITFYATDPYNTRLTLICTPLGGSQIWIGLMDHTVFFTDFNGIPVSNTVLLPSLVDGQQVRVKLVRNASNIINGYYHNGTTWVAFPHSTIALSANCSLQIVDWDLTGNLPFSLSKIYLEADGGLPYPLLSGTDIGAYEMLESELVSRPIKLVYFSTDIAGNTESPHEIMFNYDSTAPITIIDETVTEIDPLNDLKSIVSLAKVTDYNTLTQQYEFSGLTPSLRDNLVEFLNWHDTAEYIKNLNIETTPISFTANITDNKLTVASHNFQTGYVVTVVGADLPLPLQIDTYYYVIYGSATTIKLATTYANALANTAIDLTTTGTGLRQIIRATPEVIFYKATKIYLMAIDDRISNIVDEIILTKSAAIRELTVENSFLKTVTLIYNQTTSSTLTVFFFSGNKIYTNETFLDTDIITVSYSYTAVKETHYTTNGVDPTILSSTGHIIDLSNGSYTLKWFSIDEAGNIEDIQQFLATITVINRAPIVDLSIVKSSDLTTIYYPNGTNSWYKLDALDLTLRPTLKTIFFSPAAYAFNEDSSFTTSPLHVQFTAQEVAANDEITAVSRIVDVTNPTVIFSNITFSGNLIDADVNILPGGSDVFQIDYTYNTLFTGGIKTITIGPPDDPFLIVAFTGSSSPYTYIYNFEGAKELTVSVRDADGRETISTTIPQLGLTNIIKLDITKPVTTDDAVTGWVNSSQVVTLTSIDTISGIAGIFYSTDGTSPSIFVAQPIVPITLSATGQYTIKYQGFDNASNLEDEVTAVNIVQIDKTAPITSVVAPLPDGANGWYITSPSIILTAIDPDSGVGQVFYHWDSDPFIEYTGSFLIPSEGIHVLYFYSIDVVGNQEIVKQQTFKLDTSIPITTDNITGTWTNDNVIDLTVVDVSGTYRTYYEYALDPAPVPTPTLSSPYTITDKILIPTSGIYGLKYFTIDIAGNTESVKTASNLLYLDLIKPIVVSVDPSNLVFVLQTHLTVVFQDTLSGVDVNTVRIVVDDIEYSTSKNASFFTSSGSPQNLTCKVGPVASIPNFDNLESCVIFANDIAGNALVPTVIRIAPVDVNAPRVKGCWPKNNAIDVSRDTNVMFFIDDDISGVDVRTIRVQVANKTYQLVTTDVINLIYTGLSTDVFLTIEGNVLLITVSGVAIAEFNLTQNEYVTIKKVSDAIDALTDFTSTIPNIEYDQISSLELINFYNAQINSTLTLSVARYEDNKNINYILRSRGCLFTVMPFETFEDNYVVNIAIDATDFSGNVMTTESYSFTCKDVATPSSATKNRWYQYHSNVVKRILSNLESTYNKQSISTVFYGYFRALAMEIARAAQIGEDYRDDLYFDGGTTRPELLYQNLGYLLKFEPRSTFTHNEYREFLLTLMQMFFKGSTPSSLAEGLGVLFQSDITIKEYYQDDISQQFIFAVDVDIGSQPIQSWSILNDNISAILRLTKPAHTYFLVRYLFSDIWTKAIVDQLVRFDSTFLGTEDVRTNCADKYKIAKIITEDVSNQFDGSNNCCFVYNTPILSWDETQITITASDVQATASGGPISVISVDGFTGQVCFDRNPAASETVNVIYKFNKYVIYREISFYLNTYTVTGGSFDLSLPYLLNQTSIPSQSVIAYDIPEQLHAHICETDLISVIDWGTYLENTFPMPEEYVAFATEVTRYESVDLDIRDRLSNVGGGFEEAVGIVPEEQINDDSSRPIFETIQTVSEESGSAFETNSHPFTSNELISITNGDPSFPTLCPVLFYYIARYF